MADKWDYRVLVAVRMTLEQREALKRRAGRVGMTQQAYMMQQLFPPTKQEPASPRRPLWGIDEFHPFDDPEGEH